MQAMIQDRYGSPDVLDLREVDRPEPGVGEVLVRVRAAGVDRGVWHVVTGRPYVVRAMGFGLRAPKVSVPGSGVAGIVEALGRDVTGAAVGDEVYGTCEGGFAEYASARADHLVAKPPRLSFEQAATVPHACFAALQALRDHGKIEAGQSVLIIGASGAVGTAAVQIAKAFDARVTGVCSTGKVDLVRSLGADDVVDYTRDDFASRGERYDLIVDNGGSSSLSRLRSILAPRGRLVIVGGEGGGRWFGLGRQLRASVLSPFVGQHLGTFVAKERREDLLDVNELVEAGKLTPVVDCAFPLPDAADALRYLESGSARGTVVVKVPAP